ncbi:MULTISPECIES: DASH family cryptochrome [Leptolyngbya]|uniref:DASH family cryptochrome n=1 Tax=Leptolyngbya TaxID=47251 RepID=UPI001686F3E0|nr:DASH family cryptochrome [Leptolyngbya sp. FACHB-1624]MBD1858427.1 DASH family cryptochrome [Leptolyngbya sp. FACHB-1624]
MESIVAEQRIIIWYRNDLRVHDHEPLMKAIRSGATVIPVYCFEPRQFGTTPYGFPKTGAFRAQFLLESVADLRQNLRSLGSDLIIRQGKAEEMIPAIAKALAVESVYYYHEVTSEETQVEDNLREALKAIGTSIQAFWGMTLYHPDDLPFAIKEIPELFTNFRKGVEKSATVNEMFPTPERLAELPDIDRGEIPTLEELGLEPPQRDPRGMIPYQGGETAGKARLAEYFWKQDALKAYKETRNGMLGVDYSSKFSAWLALGCLSPRYIYSQVQNYESQRVRNDSTYWLIFELLWRDFFRFICAKHGNQIFYQSGLLGISIPWKDDVDRFELWQTGNTGFPLIDANMQEIAATGFMSNRGRQNVASFLTKNLGINWQWGAEWFESILIDYDVCSNWGNWNYNAGVGNDARGFRFFNIIKQSKDYDPDGSYVKHWLPALKDVPAAKVHEPWKLLPVEQQRFQVRIGVDYPRPIVDLFKSAQANESIYNAAVERSAPKRAKSRK